MARDKAFKKMVTTHKNPDEIQGRDSFLSPRYATRLLIPFLHTLQTSLPFSPLRIWECAANDGRIVRPLRDAGFIVTSTDISSKAENHLNFITEDWRFDDDFDCIVTNPPFSIRKEFIERAVRYDKPCAFLINADYSAEAIKWVKDYGFHKVVPNRRISFLTPNIVRRVHEGEVWEIVSPDYPEYKKYKDLPEELWKDILSKYKKVHNYSCIDDTPNELLKKYSSAQFHSLWLVRGFGLSGTETFIDLPLSWMKDIK
jgi:hypothetical protein